MVICERYWFIAGHSKNELKNWTRNIYRYFIVIYMNPILAVISLRKPLAPRQSCPFI